MLVPGVEPAQWPRARALAGGAITLRFAAGIHPRHAGSIEALEAHVARARVHAIGELGWDRAAPFDDALVDAQLALARAAALPVILHVVGAHGHALERLRRHPPLAGVVHAFSGSAELVREYVRRGLAISIGPSVLGAGARRVHAAARAVPDEALLVETDAPDGIAEPADVARVVAQVAHLRGREPSAIAALTHANAARLFG